MKEVIEEAFRLIKTGQSFVISTVVSTKGSTPQKPGAKLLIREDGTGVGTLGGGCVEGDIWYLANQLFENKEGPLFRHYKLNEDFAERGGLVCGGTMFFFIDPVLESGSFTQFINEIIPAYHGGPSVAMATLVNSIDKNTRLGAKIMVKEDGSTIGSLGNAALDEEAKKIGRKIAAFGDNKFYKTGEGFEIYIEGYSSPPTIILIGGGHVNKAISNLADTLGFRIFIIDDRAEFADKERFPEAEEIIIADYDQGLEKIDVTQNTYIIVATRGHRYDDIALAKAIGTPARFVGLLGSKRKIIEIYKNFKNDNVSLEKINEVHAPLGLNIGALTPEELAVSVMSEVIMVRRGGDGTPMKMNGDYLKKIILK